VAAGIAFAAAYLWEDVQARSYSSRVLARLVPTANETIASAIERVFWTDQPFAMDEPTEQLLRAFADCPESLSRIPITNLVHHLVPLVSHNRRLASDICSAILRNRDSDTELFEAGPDLVTIAMTLQRFSDSRSEGLTLLETMLQLGLDDAFNALRDIDIHPSFPKTAVPVFRRRRRRSRK
jgi:hypothetical protein